jgi:uncharacterized protein (DUF1501 family)
MKTPRSSLRKTPAPLTRRDLLKRGGAGLGAAMLSSFVPLGRWSGELRADAVPGLKRMVIINLRGGNDGLNTVVPVGLSAYYSRRPSLGLASASCLSLAGGPGGVTAYKFHPSMVKLQALWNEGAVAVIHGVGYPSANLSHFVSEDIWSIGMRNAAFAFSSGWIARFADLYTSSPMEIVSVGMGTRRDFIGGSTNPFIVDSLTSFQFNTDWRYQKNHALRLQKVQELLALNSGAGLQAPISTAIQQAIDLEGQIETARTNYVAGASYENQAISQRLRDVAILVQGGFETKIFYSGFGGFDTHSGQAAAHATLLARLDNAIGSFADDLKAMGVWNDVAVCVISEFGRRNYENGSDGTDHGKANCLLVVGGAVSGGIYGPDPTNADLNQENVNYQIDFRTVYKQVIESHLGLDADPIFTEAQETNASPGAFI